MISVLNVSSFSIEELFDADGAELCEEKRGEAEIYKVNQNTTQESSDGMKRKLGPEENHVTEQPPKKKKKNFATSSSNKKTEYKHRKKQWREEKDWRKYGHLPRPSTKAKVFPSSHTWKSSSLITNLRMNDGGYTSRSRRFQNTAEVGSLEEALALGFVLIKSEKL